MIKESNIVWYLITSILGNTSWLKVLLTVEYWNPVYSFAFNMAICVLRSCWVRGCKEKTDILLIWGEWAPLQGRLIWANIISIPSQKRYSYGKHVHLQEEQLCSCNFLLFNWGQFEKKKVLLLSEQNLFLMNRPLFGKLLSFLKWRRNTEV